MHTIGMDAAPFNNEAPPSIPLVERLNKAINKNEVRIFAIH